jgi:hypothetical protein
MNTHIPADVTSWLFLGGRYAEIVIASGKDAEELKARGNTSFSAGNYSDAADLYSRAIETCPQEQGYFDQMVRIFCAVIA